MPPCTRCLQLIHELGCGVRTFEDKARSQNVNNVKPESENTIGLRYEIVGSTGWVESVLMLTASSDEAVRRKSFFVTFQNVSNVSNVPKFQKLLVFLALLLRLVATRPG